MQSNVSSRKLDCVAGWQGISYSNQWVDGEERKGHCGWMETLVVESGRWKMSVHDICRSCSHEMRQSHCLLDTAALFTCPVHYSLFRVSTMPLF